MVEVLDHAPANLTLADRVLLMSIAEKANDITREAYPGWEVLAHRMHWRAQKDGGKNALSTALARMADRGVEVRVPLAYDAEGRPVYAVRGRRTTYRLPVFASLDLAERVDSSATQTRVDESATHSEKGWQSSGRKGGTPEGQRVDSSATPIPQEPSLNPQAGWLDPETLIEPHKTIARSLGDTSVTVEELKAIHHAVIDKHHPRDVIQYVRGIAAQGGFSTYLADIRSATAEERRRAIEEQRRTAEPCEHGQPGGQTIRTSAGEPSCPLCRRGTVSADPATGRDDSAVVKMLTAFREGALEVGHNPTTAELVHVAGRARQAVAAGLHTSRSAA